ncbi:MAG: protein kinase [Chloroflexi bacterium RBG_19FT_COMBO_50_10]|nr:MAG: protein kinase [Chloroflexi bacterium RBG_19FT_COMBO_50_10]
MIGGSILDTHRITQDLDNGPESRSSEHLQPGTTLVNRYLIQGIVGVGGMGAVYSARDLHFPNVVKRVAVKEMINMARDPGIHETIVRNFEREANILATLNHPSIPRIYDYFTHNERSYLIIEFIDGKDLEAIVSEAQDFLPEAQVIDWSIQLCDVLSYLHNYKPEPVIFRDMKPSNVMLSNHGNIMLVDFGIAKTFQTGQKGTMIGTEGYSPPEQYKGDATPFADIYALGATLHHLLTRRDPRLEPPFSFSERKILPINPAISPEVEAVIYTALQYNPADRFQSTEAMKEALLNAARKTGLLQSSGPAIATSLSKADTKALWKFECEDEVRGSPTIHEGILYVGAYDNNLYALQSKSGEFIWKYATDGGVVSKPVVYEGNVYFGSEDKHLYVISTRSGKIVWTYVTQGPIRSSPRIAEGHVFIGSDDAYLHAVNAMTGRRAWSIDAGAPIRSTPLAVGEYVYFGTESGDMFCVDLGGTIKWRFKAKRSITSSPVYAEGVIFVGSVDTVLYALDARTGYVLWRFRMNRATISTPCLVDNYIFIGSVDGNIYCIDIHSAKEVWHYPTENQVNSSPIIHKDAVLCGSIDGSMYCLEYRTGRLRWKFSTQGAITGTPAVSNDILYTGSSDHNIYAISI